jgi:O-antigen ligase
LSDATLALTGPHAAPRSASGGLYLRQLAARLLPGAVTVWILAGGLVFIEPSPYELAFLLVLPLAVMAGVSLHRHTLNLLNLLLCFIPFALIAVFQVRFTEPQTAMIFSLVTMFLWLTSYFAANFVADAPFEAMRRVMRAYLAVALVLAVVGLGAYLQIIPYHELFLRYGRAQATFQDPNVYGPFLIVPAMFALTRALLDTGRRSVLAGLAVLVLAGGVFASFSRAAWVYFLVSALAVVGLCFVLEAKALLRARILVLALVGVILMAGAVAALLSIPSVADLFATRFSLEQNYDTGETGRFGRQAYALDLVLTHPWGLGPGQFSRMRIVEDVHNTYVTVFLAYGWLGGLSYCALIVMTLWRAVSRLFVASPNRRLLIPLTAAFVPLAFEAAIIDIDHWRHNFLLIGLIWGVTAVYGKVSTLQRRERSLI